MRGVYFIQMAQFVKIGYSTQIAKRLDDLRTGFPLVPVLLGIIENVSQEREQALHRKFARQRMNGEWFRLDSVILSYINKNTTHKRGNLCAEISETLKEGKKKSRRRRGNPMRMLTDEVTEDARKRFQKVVVRDKGESMYWFIQDMTYQEKAEEQKRRQGCRT